MNTESSLPETGQKSSQLRTLLYHLHRVSEIAKTLPHDNGSLSMDGFDAAWPGDAHGAIDQLVHQVQRRAVSARISLSDGPGGDAQDACARLQDAVLAGPGEVRVTVPWPMLAHEAGRQRMAALAEANADTRIAVPGLPTMVVLDRKIAVLCLLGEERLSVVRETGMVKILSSLFDAIWEYAPDQKLMDSLDIDALETIKQDSGVLADVLRHLGSGRIDAVAAQQLGYSIRTYRRYVADLMRMLQATSRFQAGVRAAQWMMATASPDALPAEELV
jgi:hypothetical protein